MKVYIHEESLWNNRFILIEKKPILYKNWLKHGIKNLQDLYHDTGVLLSPDQLGQKYDLNINLMSYNSLIKAIPNTWKHLMLNRQMSNNVNDHEIY